jgi:hypothetical protein
MSIARNRAENGAMITRSRTALWWALGWAVLFTAMHGYWCLGGAISLGEERVHTDAGVRFSMVEYQPGSSCACRYYSGLVRSFAPRFPAAGESQRR